MNLTQERLATFVKQKYDSTGLATVSQFTFDDSPNNTYCYGSVTTLTAERVCMGAGKPKIEKETIPIVIVATRLGRGWSLAMMAIHHLAFLPDK